MGTGMDTDAHMHTHWGGDAGAGTGMDTDARMHTHWGGDAAEGPNVDGHAHTHTHRPYFALYISSIWLFPSCTLHNKPAMINKAPS